MTDNSAFFFQNLMWSLPLLVVYLLGLVLAIVFWRRCPAACGIAAGGFLLFLLTIIIRIGNSWFIQMQLSDPSRGAVSDYTAFNMIVSTIATAVQFLGWILILIAIYGWRQEPLPYFPPSTIPFPPLPTQPAASAPGLSATGPSTPSP